MLNDYIKKWIDVIEMMKNENTYKLAWGRALLECLYSGAYSEDDNNSSVELRDIASLMLKYYWNQSFFFNLKQASPFSREPLITKYTNNLIECYKKKKNNALPVWFDKFVNDFNDYEIIEKTIKKIANVLPNDVSWRFKQVNNIELPLYEYDNKARSSFVIFKNNDVEILKDYYVILSKLLNYKWAQLLEKFNYAPRIASKVTSISNTKLRRESLSKYKNELLKQFDDGVAIDFYTGEPLEEKDISVDHVIPWSFMYSDDIWNLVLTSKSNNSSKSNTIPSEKDIKRLKERNKMLVGKLSESFNMSLEESLKNHYVDKYYFDCRM